MTRFPADCWVMCIPGVLGTLWDNAEHSLPVMCVTAMRGTDVRMYNTPPVGTLFVLLSLQSLGYSRSLWLH